MPKKTRREKVLAAARRNLKLLEEVRRPSLNEISSSNKKRDDVNENSEKFSDNLQLDEREIKIKNFFLKDMKKSLLLIALIIALEIIVYFGTIYNYFRF